MAKKALAVVLSATCLLGGPAGCGGSGSAAFVARANRICGAFYTKAYALPAPIGRRQLEAYPKKQQTLLEGELAGLRALTAPVAQRDRYTGYVADSVALDKQYSVAITFLRSDRPANLRLSAARRDGRRLADLHVKVERDARDLGLTGCAKDPYSATHYASS